jgi:hypothetical protein
MLASWPSDLRVMLIVGLRIDNPGLIVSQGSIAAFIDTL